MYGYNERTEAISARLAPGLKDRIDFEVASYRGMNRNRFINEACMLYLELRNEVRCGNLPVDTIGLPFRRFLLSV